MAAIFPRVGLCRSRVVQWRYSNTVRNEQFSSHFPGRTFGNGGNGAHVRTLSSSGIFPKARNEPPRKIVDRNWFAFRGLASLPKTLEELRDILAKEKGEVEEELWKNALKVRCEERVGIFTLLSLKMRRSPPQKKVKFTGTALLLMQS